MVSATGLTKSFDDRILFEELSFAIENGMRLGIVGGNGSGKSTLFRILSGELEADAGEVDIGCGWAACPLPYAAVCLLRVACVCAGTRSRWGWWRRAGRT